MPERSRKLNYRELEEQQQYIEDIRTMADRPQTYHVVTYGCQMNAHDSEKIAGMLQEMGLTEAKIRDEADFVIFNTCCVRDNAERRALGNVTWLKEVRKHNPKLMIGVCGCMIQEPGMAEKIVKQYGFVDLAFGTAVLHRFPEFFWRALHEEHVVVETGGEDVIVEGMPARRLRHDAAYISIMQGCNNFCSFCIVPYVRGRERSRDMKEILSEAAFLHENGCHEIMLLGQNVNSYGKNEKGSAFPELLKALDNVGIERIRFMTSHPKDLSDELIDVMANAKHVLPQFHLPVQSGDDDILRRMNRHYDRKHYLDRVQKLRSAIPGIGLTTDLIVAFPGETEEQFEHTLSLVDEVGYDSAFTFIYSPRTGTAAAKMPDQIPPEVASDRIQRLIALQEKRQREEMMRFVETQEEVLIEGLSKRNANEISGRGKHGISVTISGSENDIGKIIPVQITGVKLNTLAGIRMDESGCQ